MYIISRVDDIISKLDYITDVAMQAILNHLENEEVVYTISSTLKVRTVLFLTLWVNKLYKPKDKTSQCIYILVYLC